MQLCLNKCLHFINMLLPSLLEVEIPSASKGDTNLYQVTCLGASGCRDIGINLVVASGDADLYAR